MASPLPVGTSTYASGLLCKVKKKTFCLTFSDSTSSSSLVNPLLQINPPFRQKTFQQDFYFQGGKTFKNMKFDK
jgi:hypothetical protein